MSDSLIDPSGADDAQTPSLHVDSDWKAEAERERQRLAEAEAKEKARQAEEGGGRGELPPADFRGLVSMLASQALMGLGTMTDPESKGVIVDLEGSRFAIDLLGVLEEKTQGNLETEEATELTQALGALRGRYVELAKVVAEQMAAGGGGMPGMGGGMPGMGGGMPGAGGAPGGSGLIDPTA